MPVNSILQIRHCDFFFSVKTMTIPQKTQDCTASEFHRIVTKNASTAIPWKGNTLNTATCQDVLGEKNTLRDLLIVWKLFKNSKESPENSFQTCKEVPLKRKTSRPLQTAKHQTPLVSNSSSNISNALLLFPTPQPRCYSSARAPSSLAQIIPSHEFKKSSAIENKKGNHPQEIFKNLWRSAIINLISAR